MSDPVMVRISLITSGATYHCKKCGREFTKLFENNTGGVSGGTCIDHGNIDEPDMFTRLNDVHIIDGQTRFGPYTADFYQGEWETKK